MEERYEAKKFCRVCGRRVPSLYKRSGGRRCVVCLHRTHGEHLAGNRRVCLDCSRLELHIPAGYSQTPCGVTLAHLADLHFGGEESQKRADLLKNWFCVRRPDYVLVSGDMTRMAGREEFQRAALWIRQVESSGTRVAVVPGNHDIGYWGNPGSVAGQAVGRKYHRWIKEIDRPIEPCLRGPGCVILGLNSAHGINPARLFNGYLDRGQRARAVEIFRATPPEHLKVVFCHHPLVRFADNRHRAVFRSVAVREELMAAGADLLLWGHQHRFASTVLDGAGKKCVAVQGPTLSDRVREDELPGFAVVEWFFKGRAVIRTFNIVEDEYVEEDKEVEYRLKEEQP